MLFLVLILLIFILVLITKFWIYLSGVSNSIFQKYQLNDIIEFQNKIINENKKNIKFMSFNFYLQSFVICDNYLNGDCKYERFNHFIDNHLDNYDIICFQEVYGTLSLFCKNIIKKAKLKGFNWYIVPEKIKLNSFKFMDSGLLIISKYPILYTNTVKFNDGLYKDVLAEKSFQYCIIDTLNKNIDERYIHVINTHLQSDYSIKDNNAMIVKLKQLKQLRDFIDFYNLRKEALIVTGDFNINCYSTNNNKNECNIYSKDYYQLLSILNLSINNDSFHKFNYERKPTLYCSYNKKTQKEIDTRYRPEYINDINDINDININYVNIPKCVDYIFFKPPLNNWLKLYKSEINKLQCKTSDKYLQQCSDHYALTTEFT
jgi:exonuclease III